MSTMNRLMTAANEYQGTAKRVLCLCSGGLLRSPTAAWVLSNAPWSYNTRAAGVTTDFALIPVDEVLLQWAQEIVCVEPSVETRLRAHMRAWEIELNEGQWITTLKIPDIYPRMAPELIERITNQYRESQHVA